jgi:hypothetical protein
MKNLQLENLSSRTKPAPNTSLARRVTDWSKLSNEDLKFALDILSLHHSPFEWEVDFEINKRIEAGTWLNLNEPLPHRVEINFKGFLPYLAILLGLLVGVLLVGSRLLNP